MAEAVYVLCALTSAACAALLLRGYLRSRARFLLWSSLCFIAMALNNLLLVIDKVVVPDRAVMPAELRSGIALLGMAVLMYGLVWEAE
jgi:hypothetical protein